MIPTISIFAKTFNLVYLQQSRFYCIHIRKYIYVYVPVTIKYIFLHISRISMLSFYLRYTKLLFISQTLKSFDKILENIENLVLRLVRRNRREISRQEIRRALLLIYFYRN